MKWNCEITRRRRCIVNVWIIPFSMNYFRRLVLRIDVECVVGRNRTLLQWQNVFLPLEQVVDGRVLLPCQLRLENVPLGRALLPEEEVVLELQFSLYLISGLSKVWLIIKLLDEVLYNRQRRRRWWCPRSIFRRGRLYLLAEDLDSFLCLLIHSVLLFYLSHSPDEVSRPLRWLRILPS